ncbi:MAG: rod shape-determining protein MreD [Chloroflexota bacterium]|jgi:rod shape-determining protein MreD
MGSSVYLAVPLMALLLILQTSLLPYFPVLGFVPQLLFLVAFGRGLLKGVNEGVVWAFVAGLFVDLFSAVPIGVSAVTYMAAIPSILWLSTMLPENRYLIPMLQAGLATFVVMLLNFFLLRLFGFSVGWEYMELIPPTAVLHAALILPIYWLMFRLDRLLRPRPVEL